MRRLLPLVLVLMATLAVLGTLRGHDSPRLSTVASAESPNRAGVVVDLGNGQVKTACVTFTSDSISGTEALQRAGMQPGLYAAGMGAAVCSLCGQGCPTDGSCLTCGGSSYWAYHRSQAGSSGWSYSSIGAGATRVGNGDVEGWRWGSGGAPAHRSFTSLCGAQAPAQSPSVAPATTARTTAPPPPSPAAGRASGSGSGAPDASSSGGSGGNPSQGGSSSGSPNAPDPQGLTSKASGPSASGADGSGTAETGSARAGDATSASDQSEASGSGAGDTGTASATPEDASLGDGAADDTAAATGDSTASAGGVPSILLFVLTLAALGGVGTWTWRRNTGHRAV